MSDSLDWGRIIFKVFKVVMPWFLLTCLFVWARLMGRFGRQDYEKGTEGKIPVLRSISMVFIPVIFLAWGFYSEAGGRMDLMTQKWTSDQLTAKWEAGLEAFFSMLIPAVAGLCIGAYVEFETEKEKREKIRSEVNIEWLEKLERRRLEQEEKAQKSKKSP